MKHLNYYVYQQYNLRFEETSNKQTFLTLQHQIPNKTPPFLSVFTFAINETIILLINKMNQVELFAANNNKDQSPKGKSTQKRPPQISVSKIYSDNHKWKQCKIIGKNISIRSYSAACAFNGKLYLYGGYQILNGSLHDFYSISLQETEHVFQWTQIIPKSKVNPGSRSKHALLGGKSRIYLIGGLQNNTIASNDIYEFNPLVQEWSKLKPEGAELPAIQSFGSILLNHNNEQKIIIAFGFNQKKSVHSNAIYEYNITKNKLSILFQGTENGSKDIPSPRVGCALAADSQNIYLFGGKDENRRFNDIWSFSLTDFKFKRLEDHGQVPAVRNGHTMTYYQGKLYVFGGIHDITWELDDLHIYHIKSNKWTTLEQDSPRKLDKKQNNSQHNQQKSLEKKGSKKKNWYETVGSNLGSKNSSPPMRKNFSITYNEDQANHNQSPGKMLDEQRKKVFYQKKADMLKNFQVNKQEKQKLVNLETSSQAMKNSLDVIGNPDSKLKMSEDRLTDFGKQSVSKFLQPLQNNSNIVIGKRPCARDGHCTVILADELIILGGDRHQMSFNDIFKLNLKMAEKELPA